MAYVKTNWKTGDVVTSNKLNNMETGIYDATEASASAFAPDITNPQDGDTLVYNATQQKWVNGASTGSLLVPVTIESGTATLGKTWKEISDALAAGYYTCYIMEDPSTPGQYIQGRFECYAHLDDSYMVWMDSLGGNLIFDTDSENGYPSVLIPDL